MPAKDIIHDIVKDALIKDGWQITHDPFHVKVGEIGVYIDLAAERVIAATKNDRKIAVEIKNFTGLSVVHDLEAAIGQYSLYSVLLAEVEPEREVYLAVSETIFANIFDKQGGRLLLTKLGIKVIVVALGVKEIVKWIE